MFIYIVIQLLIYVYTQYPTCLQLHLLCNVRFIICVCVCVCGRALHWQSLQIRERLGYIVEELKSYDIVGLQEVRTYIQ